MASLETLRALRLPRALPRLCKLLGQPTPAESDPAGAWYTFERGVHKLEGDQGWADVWMQDHFAWEYKCKHKDLVAAYKQLLQDREDLGNPLIHCLQGQNLGTTRRELIGLYADPLITHFVGNVMETTRPSISDIVITTSGGVVNGVFSRDRALRVVVIDWDAVPQSGDYAVEDFPNDSLEEMPTELQELLR